MALDPANAGREQDGRFSPGCSGNPAGKKAGTRHKATLAALTLLNGEAEGLTRKAVELALAGDVTALRLCFERLVPPCREAPVGRESTSMVPSLTPDSTYAVLKTTAIDMDDPSTGGFDTGFDFGTGLGLAASTLTA